MQPKQRDEKSSGDLFRARLDQIIDMRHELVRLAAEIDWAWIDDRVAECLAGTAGTLDLELTIWKAFLGTGKISLFPPSHATTQAGGESFLERHADTSAYDRRSRVAGVAGGVI